MPHRQKVLDILNDYTAPLRAERARVLLFKDFVEQNENCFLRENLKGHCTASSMIVSPDFSKVLLHKHKKTGFWMQFGGHADGNPDLFDVARTETKEETGLTSAQPVNDKPFDVGIRWVPQYQDIPEHVHYDVAFLFTADPEESFKMDEGESRTLKWMTLQEGVDLLPEEDICLRTMLEKVQKIAKMRQSA